MKNATIAGVPASLMQKLKEIKQRADVFAGRSVRIWEVVAYLLSLAKSASDESEVEKYFKKY
jgi:hypothetical protein